MGFPSFSFRSLLDCEASLKMRFAWLEKRFEYSSETSWFSPLTRRQISIFISMLFPLFAFLLFLASDPHENVRIPFVYCSTLIPFGISLLCLIFLTSIRKSDATKEESTLLSQSFLILSIILGTITNLAGAPNKFGLYLNCSYILWGFFLESPLALKTKMSLVNVGASKSIGFVRALDWWCFIVVPICLNVGLNLFSWRFTQVIFPDDTTDLVPLLEIEHQQLNRIAMEAIRKANEHLDALNFNLNAYQASKKAIEDVKRHLASTIPMFLLRRERKLYQLIMEDFRKAKEYKAVLYSILDAKKCATSLVDSKTLKDAKIPALLLVREHKLNQFITDAIRQAGEYQAALISILDVKKLCLASQLDSKILEYAKIPVLLSRMKQHINQLVTEAIVEAEEHRIACEAKIQTMEDSDAGWPSLDMTELALPVSGGDLTFNVGR